MQVKLLLFTFNLNGGLHAVYMISEKCQNGCQIFGRFSFLKTESEPNCGFLHIPNHNSSDLL